MSSDIVQAVVRGALAIALVFTVPVLVFLGVDVPDPFWALVGVPIGWYFGSQAGA